MELCLMVEGQEGVTWPQWQDLAHACEAHGIPALFRSDHYLNVSGDHPERGSLDAWGTLCAIAAVTSTLRLGTMVSPATFRHPSELAKLVVTADHISKGRIELGLGAGWYEAEHAAHGFPFPPMRERMDVLEEQLQIVIGSMTEDAFSFSGAHYTLTGLNAQPKPVQRPRPPIILGGQARARAAALAARYADEYNLTFPAPDEVGPRRERIQRACEDAGRPMIALSAMTTVLVGADDSELRRRAQRLAERIGSTAEALLSEPPSGWILGTVQSVIEQLAALGEVGVSRVFCQHLLHDDLDAVALIGERVAPALG